MRIKNYLVIAFLLLVIMLNSLQANAEEDSKEISIYNIDSSTLNDFDVIEKGTTVDAFLLNDTYTGKEPDKDIANEFRFDIPVNENVSFKATGILNNESDAGRLSKSSSLGFSTNKLFLDDGQEIHFSASSPLFVGTHPPHANSSSLGLAKAITSLAIATTPFTFGLGLGASFIVNGLLSAYQNGLSDFIWGGLDGSGLRFLERIFRKQPELFLPVGTPIPFVLNDDLKVSKGIRKEKIEYLNMPKEEALSKIQKLIEWGDLAGALELSLKTGQKEIYDELVRKVST